MIASALGSAAVHAQTPVAKTDVVVDAAAAQALSDKYFCSACHANDRTMVGPAFSAIAKKYQRDASAPVLLAVKIRNGSTGVWGQIPMPPNPTVKDDEMKQLVAWILAQQ